MVYLVLGIKRVAVIIFIGWGFFFEPYLEELSSLLSSVNKETILAPELVFGAFIYIYISTLRFF
jgi:hypothetical protein